MRLTSVYIVVSTLLLACISSAYAGKFVAPVDSIGVHVGIGSVPTDALISWFVADPPADSAGSDRPRCGGTLNYGPSPLKGDGTAGECKGTPAFDGCAFTCVLRNLEPLQEYTYNILTHLKDGAKKYTYSFIQPRGPAYTQTTTLFAFGDMGTWDPAPAVVDSLSEYVGAFYLQKENHFRNGMVLHAGDCAYAWDRKKKDLNIKKWSTWSALVESVASRIPYMLARGNWDDKESLDIRFPMPGKVRDKSYYSFNTGPFHVAVLDMFSGYDPESDQYQWLENDLRAARRQENGFDPFIIVMNHQPMYDTSSGHTGGNAKFRAMEDMLHRYKVNLLLAGDDHDYERTFPMVHGQAVTTANDGSEDHPYTGDEGVVHILAGTAGATTDPFTSPTPPVWSAHREREVGFLRMRGVGTDEGIKVYIEFHVVDPKGPKGNARIADTVWLIHNTSHMSSGSTPAGVFLVIMVSLLIIYGLLKFTGLNGRRQNRSYAPVGQHAV